MSFDKLSKEELLRTLDEDFAFALSDEERKTKATIVAAVLEGQLKFADYLAANPHQAEKFAPPVVVQPVLVQEVQTAPQQPTVQAGVRVLDPRGQVGTEPWLIKMTRKNPYYEVGKYKFTETHPYQLIPPLEAEAVLREQEGFRMAYPSELEDFYN